MEDPEDQRPSLRITLVLNQQRSVPRDGDYVLVSRWRVLQAGDLAAVRDKILHPRPVIVRVYDNVAVVVSRDKLALAIVDA